MSQTELFLVESKYSVHPAGPAHPSHSSRPFTKLSNWKNLVESCLNLRPDPLALEKQPSPFLASPSGRHAHNPIGGLLSADSDASQSLKRSFSEDTTASSSQCGSSPPDTKKSRKSFVDSHALASRPTPPYFSAHASPPPPAPASLPPPPPPSTEETTSAAEAHQRPSLPHSSSAQTLTPCTTQQQQRAATQRGCSSSSETTQHPFKSQGDEGEEEEVETICGVRRFNPWQNTRHEKPPFTYASLVAQAIHHAPEKRATLDQIYRFVVEQYPWYRSEDARSWHNSIRHNLSLRKCFVKTERDGKGAYWSLIFPNNSDESFDGVNFSTGKYRRTPSVSSHSGGGGGHRRTSGGSISSTTTGVSSLFDSISDVSSFSAASVATPPSSHHQFGGHQPVLDKEQILPPSLTAPLHHHHNNTNTNAEPFAPPPVPSRSRPQSSTRSPVTESTSSSAATTRTASPAAVAVDPVASAAAAFEVSDAAKAFMARYQGQPERPPFTFAALCAQAVTQSSSGAPSLAEIYEYIQDHYPFFQKNAKGWQVSSSPENSRRGSFWLLRLCAHCVLGALELGATQLVVESVLHQDHAPVDRVQADNAARHRGQRRLLDHRRGRLGQVRRRSVRQRVDLVVIWQPYGPQQQPTVGQRVGRLVVAVSSDERGFVRRCGRRAV